MQSTTGALEDRKLGQVPWVGQCWTSLPQHFSKGELGGEELDEAVPSKHSAQDLDVVKTCKHKMFFSITRWQKLLGL